MNVCFYAPLKSPRAPTPSGDRKIARLLLRALRHSGHAVRLASSISTYLGQPDDENWVRMEARAGRARERLARRFASETPDVWFTYHLYHKAPDLLGPELSARFGLPYVVAEASYAPKQAGGPWDRGHRAVRNALRVADHVFFLNPADEECVLPLLGARAQTTSLPPFLVVPQRRSAKAVCAFRAEWAQRLQISADMPWVVAVGMMRDGDKHESYKRLAAAAGHLSAAVTMILVGDGPCRKDVEGRFKGVRCDVRFAGALGERALATLYTAANIFVWPAVNEAIGMATLEAMSHGLPVVSGSEGAVARSLRPEETGLIADQPEETAAALNRLIADPEERARLGRNARRQVEKQHALPVLAAELDAALRETVARAE